MRRGIPPFRSLLLASALGVVAVHCGNPPTPSPAVPTKSSAASSVSAPPPMPTVKPLAPAVPAPKGTKVVPGKKSVVTKPPVVKKPDKKPPPGDDPLEALRAADKSTEALAKALPKAGVELVRTFQGIFEQN